MDVPKRFVTSQAGSSHQPPEKDPSSPSLLSSVPRVTETSNVQFLKPSREYARFSTSFDSSNVLLEGPAEPVWRWEWTLPTGAVQIPSDVLQASSGKELALQTLGVVASDLACLAVCCSLPVMQHAWTLLVRRNASHRHSRALLTAQPSGLSTTTPTCSLRGIHNYGQTCFLNSVLQSLGSLETFVAHLQSIVDLQRQQLVKSIKQEESTETSLESFSQELLELLHALNGHTVDKTCDARVDPRKLLQQIGKEHPQFQARYGMIGREQQDAQELLQALLSMVLLDAEPLEHYSCETYRVSSSPQRLASTEAQTLQAETLQAQTLEARTASSPTHHPREEKKQEDFELRPKEKRKVSFTDPLPAKWWESELLRSEENVGPSLQDMEPFPFSGWLGSSLKCCSCRHGRPIQNSPFLDLPVVPTSVSQYLAYGGSLASNRPSSAPACSLEQCLLDFTSVERVEDVECRSCVKQRETEQIRGEIDLLKGAINTLLTKRAKQPASEEEDPVEGLRQELNEMEMRLKHWQNVDPDEDETSADPIDADLHPTHFCAGHRCDSHKRLMLTRLPLVLCIHVQRRYYDPTVDRMVKTMQHVEFSEVLDLSDFCVYGGVSSTMPWAGSGGPDETSTKGSGQIPYRLKSIIEHRGNAFAGHYIAYRKNSSGAWFRISDESVCQVTWSEVRQTQAYMLFYEAM